MSTASLRRSSSNREYITSAAAPASSSARAESTLRDSGEAEGTSGFFSLRPRYSVVRSIMTGLH
jgi:hypothetical protein